MTDPKDDTLILSLNATDTPAGDTETETPAIYVNDTTPANTLPDTKTIPVRIAPARVGLFQRLFGWLM